MSTSLCNLTETKRFLDVSSSTTYDDLITDLLEGHSESIREYCGRTFDYGLYSDVKDIENELTDRLVLSEYPVTSIVALTDYDVLLTEDTDYEVDYTLGVIKLIDSSYFTLGMRAVEVTYLAGMTPEINSALKLAVKKLVADDFGAIGSGGLQSEHIGSYSYVKKIRRDGEMFPPDIQIILNQFLRNA